MKILKTLAVFLLAFLFIAQPVCAAEQENPHLIKVSLSEKNLKDLAPGDTVSVFYHLILANNILPANEEAKKNIHALTKLFFTPELYRLYANVKTNDDNYFKAKGMEGCVHFDPLLGSQDIPYGFYVDPDGKTQSRSATTNINLRYSTNTVVTLHLIKTDFWRIDDIVYPNKVSLRSKLQECVNNPKYKKFS